MSIKNIDPMPENTWRKNMTTMAYTIGFVYSNRGVTLTDKDGNTFVGFNFNPYITDKDNNKVFYQRELCWTLEDKQNFIDSIYNELNCGNVVLKVNDDEKLLEVGAEYDVIDGKQRLTTLIEFFNNEFPDHNGYYWDDFSKDAQRKFKAVKCMTFYEFRDATDNDIKKAFLNVNFTGVPMSKEHLDFVKNINL